MTVPSEQKEPARLRDYGIHPLSLRLWHGMALDAWLRALHGNWSKISPRRYPLIVTVTVFSFFNLLLKWISQAVHGRDLAQVEISPDPVFVIGHWRSGTTWLHQSLMHDPRFAAPSRIQCFCPDTFLIADTFVSRLLKRLMMKKRPMDNVEMTTDGAEEDEVALCLMGAVTPYRGFMFPNDRVSRASDLNSWSQADQAHWRKTWLGFLARVQFANPGKQLVLKSPPHSERIPEILALFPKAKFIHIHRDPYKVFMSSRKTARAMDTFLALQDHLPSDAEYERRMINNFPAFHAKLEADKALIPQGQLVTLSYEDLRADTVTEVRRIYETLHLGDVAPVVAAIKRSNKDAEPYQNNQYEVDLRVRKLVEREFGAYFNTYGYLPMDRRAAE